MELFGTKTSPYTRTVRIVAAEMGIDLPIRDMYWRKTPDDLFKINPAGRVPLLVDGDLRLGESRAICNFLMAHADARPGEFFRPLDGPTRWHEESLLGIIYGAMDSFFVVRFLNDPPAVSHPYKERSTARITHCIGAIDDIAAQGYLVDPDRFGMAEIALITATDVIEARGVADFAAFENVAAIRRRFTERPSIKETAPEI